MRRWMALGLALLLMTAGCVCAAAEGTGDYSAGEPAPAWAEVTLNERGYIDEGEYLLEDAEEGHWMYVSPTLRIQIERTYETFEKVKKKDPDQAFYCFTAEIWCDIAAGEQPRTVFTDPEKPKRSRLYRQHRGGQSGGFCHQHGLLHLSDQAEVSDGHRGAQRGNHL